MRNIAWSLLVASIVSVALGACTQNSAHDPKMTAPTAASPEAAAPALSPEAAKAKTLENMQAAFKGETNASARYAAFAKKADEEGYRQIAVLFRAASMAEGIHAQNHKIVIEEMGGTANPVTPEVSVKSTKENLEYALGGEAYEVKDMYPAFLKDAEASGVSVALISLNYAYKTEKKHEVLYKKAIAALESNKLADLAGVYYVCPTCGNTVENKMPRRCDISMTSGDRFTEVK
ncbi:MAG TPA: ferritin family protein [Saprospiraceae bacterium]|nr:ferritin family protein [Saprospiraceae bacterium]HND87479.1 ferritin family protein [Saprospiraceae bacterium]